MKAVILAGGFGTRIAEESDLIPKPLVQIGGRPILWHIMESLRQRGIREFIVCLGYKGELIKQFFLDYRMREADFTIEMSTGDITIEKSQADQMSVTLVDTGLHTQTGGRLNRIRHLLQPETFLMTYGDCVADLDLDAQLRFHQNMGWSATVLAVQPPGRFGALNLSESQVQVDSFVEKEPGDRNWVSGGFFLLEPSVLELLEGDDTVWEKEPLEILASRGELGAFLHQGFWKPMDTLRDKRELDEFLRTGHPPWLLLPS